MGCNPEQTQTRRWLPASAALVVIGLLQVRCGEEPQTQPEIFAPETISTGNVYRGTFAPNGETFYFFKSVGEGEDYRIFRSRLVDGNWTDPERLILGEEHSDLYPTVSADGDRMVFSSYRPVPGDTSSTRNANLWYVDREGDAWGQPVFMDGVSTLANYDAKPFFGYDGAIYFESISPDWSTRSSWVTRWDGEGYRAPQPFAAVERWQTWRSDLFVWGGVPGPDGSFVILDVSERNPDTGRAGTSDQWITSLDGTEWTEPVRLGAGLNSEGYDNFTFFSPDGRTLFFVRDFERFYHIPLRVALRR